MSGNIQEDITESVKKLILAVSQDKLNYDEFKSAEAHFLDILKKSDTMYFRTINDIEKEMNAMAMKFKFHSFFKHADKLLSSYHDYLKSRPKTELSYTLNIIKFLLCMSEKPTEKFWQHPDQFLHLIGNVEEEKASAIDWGAYLKEGIVEWVPNYSLSDNDDDNWSDGESHTSDKDLENKTSNQSVQIDEVDDRVVYDLRVCRRDLISKIQNGWFDGNSVVELPPSQWDDANIGVLWEKYLNQQVQNLVPLPSLNIISEYKVMREIIWQLYDTHSSVVFALQRNQLIVRDNITISSVRSSCFHTFLSGVFIPYIELTDKFNNLHAPLENNYCETYKTCIHGMDDIIQPMKQQIIKVEEELKAQETTMTLIILAEKLKNIFEPLFILDNLHNNLLKCLDKNEPYLKATNILVKLHKALGYTVNKMEQDICLTIYIQSFYYYFDLLDSWLSKNILIDYSNEFVITNENYSSFENFRNQNIPKDIQMGFSLKNDLPDDGVLNIITKDVLEIGRNLHFLRLLKQYDSTVVNNSETIYEEFVRKVLEKLCKFYNYEGKDIFEEINDTVDNSTESGDDILSEFFDEVSTANFENKNTPTLYQKICKITKSFLILDNFFESIFRNIIDERFLKYGLVVKRLLVEKYKLDENFTFLRHIFLFADDLMFPFYRRLFDQIEKRSTSWGISAWLTGHLHDTIMDNYPEFYGNSLVKVREGWEPLRDPLDCCRMISLDYFLNWPLNILITDEDLTKYKELFEFILVIKWALHTVNHLSFYDIEPKKKSKIKDDHRKILQVRLKILRFNIINLLNSIHHYIFGHIFTNHLKNFELAFEKSNDLKSIRMAHYEFINSLHQIIICGLRDSNKDGFNCVLDCVRKLQDSWSIQFNLTTFERLDACYRIYKVAYKKIDPIVNPVYVFDY